MRGAMVRGKFLMVAVGMLMAVACGSEDSPTVLAEDPIQAVPNPTVPPVSPTAVPTALPTIPSPVTSTPQPTMAPTLSPTVAPTPQPTMAPVPTAQPTGIPGTGAVLRVPGIAPNGVVTITAGGGEPVLAVSTAVSGSDVSFGVASVSIPFGGQIRVTPAVANPQPLAIGGTTFNPSNDVFPDTTAYFNFGPLVVIE